MTLQDKFLSMKQYETTRLYNRAVTKRISRSYFCYLYFKKEEVISMLKDERTWELTVDDTKTKIRWSQTAESDLENYHKLHIEDELYALICNELKLYFNNRK